MNDHIASISSAVKLYLFQMFKSACSARSTLTQPTQYAQNEVSYKNYSQISLKHLCIEPTIKLSRLLLASNECKQKEINIHLDGHKKRNKFRAGFHTFSYCIDSVRVVFRDLGIYYQTKELLSAQNENIHQTIGGNVVHFVFPMI